MALVAVDSEVAGAWPRHVRATYGTHPHDRVLNSVALAGDAMRQLWSCTRPGEGGSCWGNGAAVRAITSAEGDSFANYLAETPVLGSALCVLSVLVIHAYVCVRYMVGRVPPPVGRSSPRSVIHPVSLTVRHPCPTCPSRWPPPSPPAAALHLPGAHV